MGSKTGPFIKARVICESTFIKAPGSDIRIDYLGPSLTISHPILLLSNYNNIKHSNKK